MFIKGEWEIHIKTEPYFGRVEIYAIRNTQDKLEILGPDFDTVTTLQKGSALTPEPTMRMSETLFQAFVDAIAEKGFKPTQGSFDDTFDYGQYV